MDTRLIEYILTLQEEKNFAAAAGRLFVTPTALRQQVKKLEAELGTPLFFRSGRELELTAAGKLYVSGARAVMAVKERAMEQLETLGSGGGHPSVIRLALHQDFLDFFERVIRPQFQELRPEVELKPVVVKNTSAKQEVVNGRADLGFIIASGMTASPLGNLPILREELHLVFPSKAISGGWRSRTFEELLPEIRKLRLASAPLNTLMPAEKYYLNRAGLDANPFCIASSFPDLLWMVDQGFAYGLLPESVLKNVPQGIAHVPLEPAAAYLLEIVYSYSTPITPAVRELVLLFLRLFDPERSTRGILDALIQREAPGAKKICNFR